MIILGYENSMLVKENKLISKKLDWRQFIEAFLQSQWLYYGMINLLSI